MKLRNVVRLSAWIIASGLCSTNASAAVTGIKITEWMYSPVGSAGEFVELTNFGPAAINLAGWSYDDDSRTAGSDSLSALGTIQSGESVILTESTAAAFRTSWNLSASVKVLGGITNNLGRSDEINIYNNSNQLVDRLTFSDQNISGSIRTQGKSGHVSNVNALGANTVLSWVLSTNGDIEGSYLSVGNDIGSPGKTSFAVAAVPVPAAAWLMGSALISMAGIARRRRTHE